MPPMSTSQAEPARGASRTHRRILYVPGIRAKPEPAVHVPLLRRCVLEGVRRADPGVAAGLAASPEALRPVLWGHLLYNDYRDVGPDLPAIEALLAAEPLPGSVRDVFATGPRFTRLAHHLGDRFPGLINWLAGDATRANLVDSARYFRNAGGVGDRIRALLAAELKAAWAAGERVLLMAHSFGSVIAWDTLWELRRDAGPVEVFLTLGSPLGTRYIRRRLKGAGRAGDERFPRGIGRWENLSATGDLAALGHRFAADFAPMKDAGLVAGITDRTDLLNPFRGADGLNVHRCYGYFVNRATGEAIARWWRATTA